MPSIASREEIKELRALVRAGRLFDVVAWLDTGKPFRSGDPRLAPHEPYLVAVETGFFSMVETFLRLELQDEELGRMLRIGVELHRPDLVELLLSRGASVHAVDFDNVLLNWQPEVTKIFLHHGADYKEGSPFARAFADCCRTAIGIFKTLLQKEPDLINQANEALVEHVRKNNRKWVDLMLWLGADPRAEVVIDDEVTTALLEAAKYGRAELLRRFKVNPTQDDLNALVVAPAAYLDRGNIYQAKPEVMKSLEYLLSFGPELRQPIGSSIMEQFFRQIDWVCSGLNDSVYPRRLMEYVLCLAKHGLQWDGENLRYLRSALRRLERHHKWEMLLALAEAKALTPKAFKVLISKPPLREVVDAHPDKKMVINEAAGSRPIDSMIVQLVREHISSTAQIAAKVGISQAAVSRRADRLIKAGRLAKKAGRKYKLGPNWWSTQD